MTLDYWRQNIGQYTKYYINCIKNLGRRIRGEKVFLQNTYESYILLLPPTWTFPIYIKTEFLRATSKTWTQTLDPNPGPGPWKTWTLKNLGSEKPGPWKTWTLKNLDYEKRGKQLDAKKKRLDKFYHMV